MLWGPVCPRISSTVEACPWWGGVGRGNHGYGFAAPALRLMAEVFGTSGGPLVTAAVGNLVCMIRTSRTQQIAALTACAGALAYTASKVDLALRGRLGMPGFPAPPESYDGFGDVTAAQLGNAGLGLTMSLLALILLRPAAHPFLRWGSVVVSWAGIAMVGAGVIGFGARAAGVAPALGDPPPAAGPAIGALVVGAVWVAGWSVATVGAMRGHARPVREGTTTPFCRRRVRHPAK